MLVWHQVDTDIAEEAPPWAVAGPSVMTPSFLLTSRDQRNADLS